MIIHIKNTTRAIYLSVDNSFFRISTKDVLYDQNKAITIFQFDKLLRSFISVDLGKKW